MEEKTFFNGRWKVVEEIGKGTTGTVYKVVNSRGGVTSYSAIKEILLPKEKKEILNMYSQGATDSDITEYFENKANEWIAKEVNFLEQFKGNPNIVAIEDHDVVEREDMLGRIVVIRMELLETLEDYILTHEVTDREILKMALSVLNALVDCEERNVLHRDIKPQNVFVNRNKIFKLGDFSESKEIEQAVSNMTQRGTPNYMAPELYKGERGSKSIDTYSLGIMLYQYFNNNKLPFMPDKYKFEDAQKVLEKRMSGEELPSPKNASKELADIILKACSYKPEDRYESAMDFKEALEKEYNRITNPTVLFGNHNSREKEETNADKTVGIYSDETDITIKKGKSKGQFGEDLVEEKKEKEKNKVKEEVKEPEEEKEEKQNFNETVGIFYENNNTVKKNNTNHVKKQFGTEEHIKEEEKKIEKEKKQKEENEEETIIEDEIYKTEDNIEYHKIDKLYYALPDSYLPDTSNGLYNYSNKIMFGVDLFDIKQLSPDIKNEEDLMTARYKNKENFKLINAKKILINDVVWYEYIYKVNKATRITYIKKVNGYYYNALFLYYDSTNYKLASNFIIFILNNLKIDNSIHFNDKDLDSIEKLRKMDEESIKHLKGDLSIEKVSVEKKSKNNKQKDDELRKLFPEEGKKWKMQAFGCYGLIFFGVVVLLLGMIIPGAIIVFGGYWFLDLTDKKFRKKLSNTEDNKKE